MTLKGSGGQPDDGRPIQMILTPVAVRKARRHERAVLGYREMRDFRCHLRILAHRASVLAIRARHGRLALTVHTACRPVPCGPTTMSTKPAVRQCAPNDSACWWVHPWLASPVAPGWT